MAVGENTRPQGTAQFTTLISPTSTTHSTTYLNNMVQNKYINIIYKKKEQEMLIAAF